jgi:hypothetical protein
MADTSRRLHAENQYYQVGRRQELYCLVSEGVRRQSCIAIAADMRSELPANSASRDFRMHLPGRAGTTASGSKKNRGELELE